MPLELRSASALIPRMSEDSKLVLAIRVGRCLVMTGCVSTGELTCAMHNMRDGSVLAKSKSIVKKRRGMGQPKKWSLLLPKKTS
ncbi:hypothetical protein Y032_0109g95 [Ancylostoma ceylanicum]|uniref:Uncharacterized protein n=1 Tax=Ancylostoma ceylanicum TaxID=53326 RepID=A0A016TEZ6_9BILA|nr:hypothetical protein Y032_0109g95 [Ancylostoma ceylanicum]